MTPPTDLGAMIALALYLVGLGLAFGVRSVQQYRRTGDTGLRRISSDEGLAGRAGGALFGVALVLGAAGPILTLVAPASTASTPSWVWWAGLALTLVGLAGALWSQETMGASWRVGVDPSERTALVTTGAFAVVRNPIFSAMALTQAGIALMTPNAASFAAVVVLIVGMELQVRVVEEPYLRRVHGAEFAAYAARVGRFAPGVGRR